MTTPFIWKGDDCSTLGRLLNAITSLTDEAEGAEFMAAYTEYLRSRGPRRPGSPEEIARANVGYIIGYVGGGDENGVRERQRLYELTGVSHPVFGTSL